MEDSQKELKSLSLRILSIREEEKKYLANILRGNVGAKTIVLSSCLTGVEELIKNNNLRAALESRAGTESKLDELVSRLKKMAARNKAIESSNGTFNIKSVREKGTKISVIIPLS